MIYEGSRYDDAIVLRPRAKDGKHRPTIYALPPSGFGVSTRTYVTQEGDRYDTLAYRIWNDPELWWRIAALNPEHLYPGNLPAGTVIRLPLV